MKIRDILKQKSIPVYFDHSENMIGIIKKVVKDGEYIIMPVAKLDKLLCHMIENEKDKSTFRAAIAFRAEQNTETGETTLLEISHVGIVPNYGEDDEPCIHSTIDRD
jgi:hypothetical protein